MKNPNALPLAQRIADHFSELPQVVAVTLAGSMTTGWAQSGSDIDLYVYQDDEIPLDVRSLIVGDATVLELDNRFWEPGDEWVDTETGIHVDLMYRVPAWIEDQLDRTLRRHEAWVGYTTCFWHNALTSHILFDRSGWFSDLQRWADQPYPEPLRRAIVSKNHPILRENLSSYRYQIERAAGRDDYVSLNHRVAALLASYFDILFAVNRLPHPGEKRLLTIARDQCEKQPDGMEIEVLMLLKAAARPGKGVVEQVDVLVDGLDDLLCSEGLVSLYSASRADNCTTAVTPKIDAPVFDT